MPVTETVGALAIDLSSIGDTLTGSASTAIESAATSAAPLVAVIIGITLLFRLVKRFAK